jgi:Cu+-exporting ATPase
MFNIFKPKPSNPNLESIILKLSGLHCTSCAVNIDLALEDLETVKSNTNYAKQETKVSFDPQKTSLKQIKKEITSLGYSIEK